MEDLGKKACQQIAGDADGNNDHSVLNLGLDMIDMVALCTGGGHDGGVGDGGNMISADSSCQDGRHRNNHHGGVIFLKHIDHDGHKDRKSSPACAGGECDKDGNQENNGRNKQCDTVVQLYHIFYKIADAHLVGDAL